MTKWNEMPLAAKLGIILGAAVAVTVGLYFAAFKSTMDENAANRTLLTAKKAENERLARLYEPRLADLNRRIEMLKQQLEIQKRIVPDEKAAPEFIHMMQDRAQGSGIEIRRYTSKSANNKEFYTEVPFEMELDGPYYSVLNFFQDVAKMERIINISKLQMNGLRSKGTVGRYSYAPGESVVATCTATTFFSHEGAPPAKPGARAPRSK